MKYLFLVSSLVFSAIFVVGGVRDWGWLTDPPKWLAPVYGQALFRVFFSRKASRVFHVVLGVVFGIVSVGCFIWMMSGKAVSE